MYLQAYDLSEMVKQLWEYSCGKTLEDNVNKFPSLAKQQPLAVNSDR